MNVIDVELLETPVNSVGGPGTKFKQVNLHSITIHHCLLMSSVNTLIVAVEVFEM